GGAAGAARRAAAVVARPAVPAALPLFGTRVRGLVQPPSRATVVRDCDCGRGNLVRDVASGVVAHGARALDAGGASRGAVFGGVDCDSDRPLVSARYCRASRILRSNRNLRMMSISACHVRRASEGRNSLDDTNFGGTP